MEYEWSKPTDSLNSANPVTIAQYIKTDLEIRIENALGLGQNNAIKMRDLQRKLNMPTSNDNRKIRDAIHNMKLHNGRILSNTKDGYWVENSPEEIEKVLLFYASYRNDLSHMIKVLSDHAKNKYNKVYQLPLFML